MTYKNEARQLSSSASVKKEIYLFLFFLIAFLFFAYKNDWTYDEATSYDGVINNSLWDLLTYSKFKLANNHLPNSLYFKLLQSWHISDVVYYRLLSVGGFVLFFVANSKILKLLRINYYHIVFLIVTPFFLCFTLGRGYSLAMGFFAMSLLYLLKYIREQEVRYEYWMVIFGALSSLSIFSFLYGFLSLFAILCFFKLKRKHLINIHTVVLSIIVFALLLYVYKLGKIVNSSDPDIIGIKNFNLFKYGTISSIFSDFSYHEELMHLALYNPKLVLLIKYLKILVTLCILLPIFYGGIRFSKIELSNIKIILALSILLPFLIMIPAHIIANALYPLKRAVFYLYYLLLLLTLMSTTTFSKKAIFYIPIIVVFLTSLFYTAYVYYDLSHPTIKETIAQTGKYPLYLKSNPNVLLINSLYGVDKKNIIQDNKLEEIIPKIKNDTSNIRYLLYWKDDMDPSLDFFKNKKIYPCRQGNVLVEIFR